MEIEGLLIIFIILFEAWVVYRLFVGKRKKEEEKILIEELKKKKPSKWTEDDRRLLLKDLESKRNFLTFQQYDILKAKYSGEKSVTEMAIKAGVSPSSPHKKSVDSTTNAQKDGTKSIVKDAVIGGVVAGPAGAVVGAIHAADKNNKNGASGDGTGKSASVTKSAAIGGIVAGPAGAVVGAIHAADKNNRNKE